MKILMIYILLFMCNVKVFGLENNLLLKTILIQKNASITLLDATTQKRLLTAKLDKLYKDKSNHRLQIETKIISQTGGFDILYTIYNPKNIKLPLPDFEIPGILLENTKTLDILQTNTKLYLETKTLDVKSYFNIGALTFRDNRGVFIEQEYHYGADTFSPYAPVILARDHHIAVGSTLAYPFLDYSQREKHTIGIHKIIKNKLYPKMRIYKDSDSWRYGYYFEKEDDYAAFINPKTRYHFIVSVRFSKPVHYIHTLAPYKNFLHTLYPPVLDRRKDTRPILCVICAFGGNVSEKNKRGWSWVLAKENNKKELYFPLWEISQGLTQQMQHKGYHRILFSTFSGVYNPKLSPLMREELPYQVLTNLEPGMENEIQKSFSLFHQNKQKINIWWGISGMMPVDKNEELLQAHVWQPYNDIPYILDNKKHKAYAYRQLFRAKDLEINALSLDAYSRMEEKSAYLWIQQMQEFLPDVQFIVEQQIDILHTRSTIFLQPEIQMFKDLDLRYNILTKPPILAQYLNPNAEVQVFLQHSIMKDKEQEYVQKLSQMGYTPIVMMRPSDRFVFDEQNLTKRILNNPHDFIDVNGIGKIVH